MPQCIKILFHIYEAQHVSGDTPPIVRSLKLHWQPLVLHTWKVVGRVVAGRCQAEPDTLWNLVVKECLLSFGAESVVFQVAIQKLKEQDI
jgi:hypothetical protein